ncbi:hypothetical protein D3C80_1568010 [compost metagenome]
MDQFRKKELIMEYKNKKPEMGIISYLCIPTGDLFFGGTLDVEVRIRSNNVQLSRNFHENTELQNLWNQHGIANFEVKIVQVVPYRSGVHDYRKEIFSLLENYLENNKKAKRLIKSKLII